MNILIIPTFCGLSIPKSGIQNRITHLVMELKKRGDTIFVLESETFFHKCDEKLAKTFKYKDNKILNRELSITRDLNIDFCIKLLSIINRYNIDLIQFSHPSGIIITKFLTKVLRKNISIVYDAQNVESIFVKEVISKNPDFSLFDRKLIPIYVKILEKISCKYLIDHITSVCNEDRLFFMKTYGIDRKKVSTISSGCKIDRLMMDKIILKKETGIDPHKLVIFFHGSFSHPPNKEAFKLIEEYIAPKFETTNAVFVIGGSGVQKFEYRNIKSIGFMENLDKVISMVDIAIVPLKSGGGTKLKMFDYLGNGLPIITRKKELKESI